MKLLAQDKLYGIANFKKEREARQMDLNEKNYGQEIKLYSV